MKKTIAILTATRAEYGLLKPIIKAMLTIPNINVNIVVTGAHLSHEFGLTYKEIEQDKIKIHKKIEILLSSDSPVSISKSMGLAMISFAEYFDESKPDALIVLGDRYETLAVCCAAMNARVPIIHLYGGETTEGAVDEAIRHAITKMSYLHLTSTEEYRKRVIQLGENPKRVFTVGAIGVENALQMPLVTKKELEESINFSLNKNYALLTFHPVTLEEGVAEQQFSEVLEALQYFSEMKIIFTKANADVSGRIINQMIDDYCSRHNNCIAFESLGVVRYLSAVKYSSLVIGNSSSGLIEVPSFKIPTVNIGNRQKGRLQAGSVINCDVEVKSIRDAIVKAQSKKFQEKLNLVVNPYGDGNTTPKVMEIIKRFLFNDCIDLKKSFYDL